MLEPLLELEPLLTLPDGTALEDRLPCLKADQRVERTGSL